MEQKEEVVEGIRNMVRAAKTMSIHVIRSPRFWLTNPQLLWMIVFLLSVFLVPPSHTNALTPYREPTQVRLPQSTTGASPGQTTFNEVPNMKYDAWIYPDAPNAMRALQDGRHIDAVKAEFLHVNDDGTLEQINQSEAYPNGYSETNVRIMSQYSHDQYITVSGNMTGTPAAMQNSDRTIKTMVDLANKAGFGIELDWEDFGQWTPEYYANFKNFLRDLKIKLHENGHNLLVDGPPIYDQNSQQWYQWKYEEIAPLADGVVMMAYDNQYDEGPGSSIAPADWYRACLTWLREKAGNKGIAGVASYGYSANRHTDRISVLESDTIIRRLRTLLGSLFVTRNSDQELTYQTSDTFYDYSDQRTMDARLRLVQESGITRLSVWSLGNNPWF